MDIETNTGGTEKFIPHPIVDDTERMMRIIANPVYDKMTIARAANIRKLPSVQKSVRIAGGKERTIMPPIKSLNSDEPPSASSPTGNNAHQSESKLYSKRQSFLPISLLTRSSTHRIPPKMRRPSIVSRTSSLHSSMAENDKKSVNDSTVRYIYSQHGFEIHRYSSPNWLSIDLLAKDACESREKSFRDMINEKEQNDSANRSIYTVEYYRQRLEDLLQSYKDGHLTHDQWARQNYQLNCLKILYTEAYEHEQERFDLQERSQRQSRAQYVFNEWKEAKGEGHHEHRRSRIDTRNSLRTTGVSSVLSNRSPSVANQTTNRMSIASIMQDRTEELPLVQPIRQSKQPKKSADMYDEQRWSLNALLKRVVGLAEPLPPPSIPTHSQHSSVANISNNSAFESSH